MCVEPLVHVCGDISVCVWRQCVCVETLVCVCGDVCVCV